LTKVSNKSPVSKNGNTPLHEAVVEQSPDAAEILAEIGEQLEAKNNDGVTPLQIATIEGFEDLARILIRKGANLEAVSQHFQNF